MRIHLLSDLHLEFGPFEPTLMDADVVLCGFHADSHTTNSTNIRTPIPRRSGHFSGRQLRRISHYHCRNAGGDATLSGCRITALRHARAVAHSLGDTPVMSQRYAVYIAP